MLLSLSSPSSLQINRRNVDEVEVVVIVVDAAVEYCLDNVVVDFLHRYLDLDGRDSSLMWH